MHPCHTKVCEKLSLMMNSKLVINLKFENDLAVNNKIGEKMTDLPIMIINGKLLLPSTTFINSNK
jgi:hypothetical protein